MRIVLILSNWFFFFEKLLLEQLLVIFSIFVDGRQGFSECWNNLSMDYLIDWHIGVLIFVIFQFIRFLLLVELLSFNYLCHLFMGIMVIFHIMLQSYLHIFHSSIKVAQLPNLLLLSFNVPQLKHLFSFMRFQLYLRTKNRNLYHFLEKHISICIYFNLKIMYQFFLC